ncbi:hypothetical protein POJ06DRAFT_245098 [Lipomyces tetrasporus]|uniref:Uncharacterized protein n=1 Tax=Lipomyces tetrasporus TaxID=54092 RepID=A0AAD7QW82_9ASCO|nr:uncharacterized protein POJ06DRAFT_245098 [Lipomyces tetrasporus]KAJ8102598.1 hypothetical protein POJ06DRAFT_245098 [Lipomyces tetrasporus]
MASQASELETSEGKEFSHELDQIFGLDGSKTTFSARSSSMIDQQHHELSIIEQQIRATDEQLRRRREELELGATKPTTSDGLGNNEDSTNAFSARTSVPRRVPRKSLEKSHVDASAGAADTLYNPRSRRSSNVHTIASAENGSMRSRDSSPGDRNRKTSMGAIGAKLQSWTMQTNQEKSQRTSGSASDRSLLRGNGNTAIAGAWNASVPAGGDTLQSSNSGDAADDTSTERESSMKKGSPKSSWSGKSIPSWMKRNRDASGGSQKSDD